MKFPNFTLKKYVTARAFVLLVGIVMLASTGFSQTDLLQNIGINIDQCANKNALVCSTASGSDGYVRGNVNESKSTYFEGDFVPIRVVIDGLTAGTPYKVTLGYDYTKGGKYAVDYLGDYDYTASTHPNDPCVNELTPCPVPDKTTAVPLDPQVALGFNGVAGGGDDITQIAGSFACFNCTISAVSAYNVISAADLLGDSSKQVTLTFTPNAGQTKIVIAYGAHISTRKDWGTTNSAINISGSPYHNYIVNFTDINDNPLGNGGNRDLQLAAAAVIFPADITIVKLVDNGDGTWSNLIQSFNFTWTSQTDGTKNFSLKDTDPAQFGGGSTTGEAVTGHKISVFGAGGKGNTPDGTIKVFEANDTSYSLFSIACTVDANGGALTGTATGDVPSRTATIVPQEGNKITCTFTNTLFGVTAAPASVSGRVTTASGAGVRGISVQIVDRSTGEVRLTLTNSFGFYTFNDLDTGDFYQVSVASKKYQFAQAVKSFSLTADMTDVNFTAVK